MVVQIYGWWYWLRGAKGHRPPIRSDQSRSWSLRRLRSPSLIAAARILGNDAFTEYAACAARCRTLSVSVVAQVLLNRKRIENWPVWIVQRRSRSSSTPMPGLWLFTALYVFFFFNAFWGWWEWRQAMKKQSAATA